MKKHILPLAIFLFTALNAFSQPLVYFDFVTHNEETGQWNGAPFYNNNRNRLINLANYFQTNGITWNMQSDWVYLTNVLTKETPQLMLATNNKNILRWMHEDKGVEMDPHAHESQYIYPDVVKLMDSIGLPESKLMGGTIYNDNNGMNVWTNLINGQNGVVFPDKFWQPDYMMGGGTPNHVNDLKYYGFWNPQDTAHYLTHDPSNHLRHFGVGCEMKIKDTTTVAYFIGQVHEVVQNVQSGLYPANGFYVQSIFFSQADLNNLAFYNKVVEIADSINAIVATGVAQWKTLKQAYTEWETAYNAQMFQWECGQIITGVDVELAENRMAIYPNPFEHTISLLGAVGMEKFELSNTVGQTLWAGKHIEQVDFTNLPVGLYFLKVTSGYSMETFKILKE